MWESINSYVYDDRMLHFLSKLTEMHVSPEVSDPRKLTEIPDDERSEGEQRPRWSREDLKEDAAWHGIYKDVGIFTEHEWGLLMCKCLASMGTNYVFNSGSELIDTTEIPLADTGSLSTAPTADNQMGFEISRLPKANWRIRKSCVDTICAWLTYTLSISGTYHCLFYGSRWFPHPIVYGTYASDDTTTIWNEYTANSV